LSLWRWRRHWAGVIAHHGVPDEGVYFIQKPFSLKDLWRKPREVLEDQDSAALYLPAGYAKRCQERT